MAGLQARHVPYKGSAPALTDVMNGQVSYAIETVAATMAHIKSGRLKAYGVTTARRSRRHAGARAARRGANVPGYDAAAWIGYVAPGRHAARGAHAYLPARSARSSANRRSRTAC